MIFLTFLLINDKFDFLKTSFSLKMISLKMSNRLNYFFGNPNKC